MCAAQIVGDLQYFLAQLKSKQRVEAQHLRLHTDDAAFDIWLKPSLKAFYPQTFQFIVVVKDALDRIAMYGPSCCAKGSDPMASTRLFFSWILCFDAVECVVSFW